jgi:hypothetical protein
MERQFIILMLAAFACTLSYVNAQTPYDNFAPEQGDKAMLQLQKKQFQITNSDLNNSVKNVIFDQNSSTLYFYKDDKSVIGSLKINPLNSKFTTIDRFAEKYPWQSPYCYAANNPVNYIDVNGDSIWISYNDANNQQQRMLYAQGMEYKGNDKFVSAVVSSLNKMSSVDIGKTVLDKLTNSSSNYNFTNTFATDRNGNVVNNALSFDAKTGEINAGVLTSNSTMLESQKMESAGHELFHAYQTEFGESGATINREVGAYVFGRALATNLGYGTLGYGNFTPQGQLYESAMQTLSFSPSFNQQAYGTAINNFSQGASVNVNGMYNRFIIRSNDMNPVIKSLYPLIK